MEKFILPKYKIDSSSEISQIGLKAKKYNDIINLSIGDIDLDTDKRIIDKMYEKTLNGQTHYANTLGLIPLREEIVKVNKEDYNLDINLNEVFVATSATHAMYLVLKALISEGDEVITFGPYFISYKKQVELNGGKLVEVKTTKEDDFQIDFDLLKRKINSKTKAIIINTPCNPTGKCFTLETLKKLNEIVVENDLVLISDEIYTIYTYNGKFIPILSVNPNMDNIISIRAASKEFAMTGFRMGYIIASSKLIEVIDYINEGVNYSAPTMSQNAYLEALKLRHEIYPVLYEEFKNRSIYAYNRLKNISFLEPIKPDGTIYMWVDIRKSKMSSVEFTQWLLEKHHILVLPGTIFGDSGEGYIRIALTVNQDMLKEAFDRLEK